MVGFCHGGDLPESHDDDGGDDDDEICVEIWGYDPRPMPRIYHLWWFIALLFNHGGEDRNDEDGHENDDKNDDDGDDDQNNDENYDDKNDDDQNDDEDHQPYSSLAPSIQTQHDNNDDDDDIQNHAKPFVKT